MSSKIADIRQSYVDGRFVSGDGEPLAVENPYTEEVIAQVETLSLAQMEEAVLAARRAFDSGGWSGLRREERIDAVLALGEYLAGRAEELGATLTAEAGSTASMLGAQVGMPLAHLRAACEIYRTMPDVEHTPRPLPEVILGNRVTASMMRYEPIGVVSAIAAYNFPLQTPLWKFVPALLTGSTVIVRPSPLTPIATLVIGEAAEAVGLPAGVLNVVVEGGVEGGQLLSSHPGGRLRQLHRLHRSGQGDHGPGVTDGEAGAARTRRQVGRSCTSTTPSSARRWVAPACSPRTPARRAWHRPGCSFPRTARPRCWKRRRASPPCSRSATRATRRPSSGH